MRLSGIRRLRKRRKYSNSRISLVCKAPSRSSRLARALSDGFDWLPLTGNGFGNALERSSLIDFNRLLNRYYTVVSNISRTILAISDALKDSWLDQIFNTRFVSWFKHWEYTEIRGCAAVLNTQVGDPVVLISFFFLFKCVFESFWLYSSPDLDRWAPPDSCIVLIIVFSDRGSPAGKLNENS